MQKELSPEERLIVAADFKPETPNGRDWVRTKVLTLADNLQGTGVCLKINSALRACGYGLIDEIHARDLLVFADLKLIDIKETLSTDGILLREAKPELLTTVCTTGITAMQALKNELPDTEVLGVTVLTSLNDDDSQAMFTCSTKEAVMRLAQIAADAKVIDGLISSGGEAEMLRKKFGVAFSLNTPAIHPEWAIVQNDDQNPDRIMTPAEAIKAGADRIVIGRPIVLSDHPYDATMWTIEEIALAMA